MRNKLKTLADREEKSIKLKKPRIRNSIFIGIAALAFLSFIWFLAGCENKTTSPPPPPDQLPLKINEVFYVEGNKKIPRNGAITPDKNADYTVCVSIQHNDSTLYNINHMIYYPVGTTVPLDAVILDETNDEDPRDNYYQYTLTRNAGTENTDVEIIVENYAGEEDRFKFHVIPGGFNDGALSITPSDTFYHDNDTGTVEFSVQDVTDPSYRNLYDSVEVWINGIKRGSAPPGGTVDVYNTSDVVGDVPIELKYKASSSLIGSVSALVHGLNHPPDFPEADHDFFQVSAGATIGYYLVRSDPDGDPLTLETQFANTDPDSVTIREVEIPQYGPYWQVIVDTTGWASGNHYIGHRAKDNYGAVSNWENIDIKIN